MLSHLIEVGWWTKCVGVGGWLSWVVFVWLRWEWLVGSDEWSCWPVVGFGRGVCWLGGVGVWKWLR